LAERITAQISKQLNRSRGSVCGKAMRLRRDDLLPAGVETRPDPAQTTVTPIIDTTVPLEMRRCSLVELDDGQSDVHQVATQFCGGDAVPGFPYCRHHLRIARYDSGLPSDGGPHDGARWP
jgi:hypothetical protein